MRKAHPSVEYALDAFLYELKTHVISGALRKRFPKGEILNVTGIRRQESKNRSKMPIWAPNSELTRKGAARNDLERYKRMARPGRRICDQSCWAQFARGPHEVWCFSRELLLLHHVVRSRRHRLGAVRR
jgi:hypothetical protein